MKTKIITSVLALTLSGCTWAFAQVTTTIKTEQQKDSVYYTCSMHPEIKSDKPGKCPKCGMDLFQNKSSSPEFKMDESKNFNKQDSAKSVYTCPMHPDVISDKPGKCPKCGMDLVQKSSSSSEHKMDMMMCPMHGMVDMNHKHDEQKKNPMKMMAIGMGAMMVVMMTMMLIIIGNR